MASGLVLREGHLRVQLANRLALKYGVSLVREMLADKTGPLHSSDGLTTDEIYKISLQKTPSSDFYNPHIKENMPLTTPPVPKTRGTKKVKQQPPSPPNPEHPMRSKTFLKKSILEYLVGTQEVAKVRTERLLPPSMKKKGKKDSVSENQEVQAKEIVWVWKAAENDAPKRVPRLKTPYRAQLFHDVRIGEVGKSDIGIGEDFSHLSTKRKRARLEDIRRDARFLRVQQKSVGAHKLKVQAIGKQKEKFAELRRFQAERIPKKSWQEQNWEDRRSAARKPLTKGRK